ncbi:MAG: hypothetical protein A2545_06600 [Planctomycetes bacterium RIFOXYD2_FULL_41_16]|nr:MAG: hypothetical protein A2094_02115 [Planctomycetes bacterium GWE2_41_14]OHC07485.1 MAG: hypothetical protein A2545_06600 [Planctomycetes bacterium RIFOXYD2_FULL_41_16]
MTSTWVTKCSRNNIPLIDQTKKPMATKKMEFIPKLPSENKSFDMPTNQFVMVFRLISAMKE